MIKRQVQAEIMELLGEFPAVAVLGPRQVGKTTLAREHALIAINIAVKERLRSFARDLYELMYKISDAENDKVKTFEYFKLYVTYRDSVQNLKVGSEIATQRLHFESSSTNKL